MAKVHAQVLGGEIVELDCTDVGEVKEELGVENHSATINGEPADDADELEDFAFVSLSTSVKGGNH